MSRAATRAWGLAGALCLVVVIVDQIAKAVIEDQIVLGEKVDFLGPLKLTLSHNEGVAFGLAGGSGAPLVAVTVAALGVVLYLFSRNPARPMMWIATGLLAGGAIGNLIDRMMYGRVTDFIVWHVKEHEWPAFNIADAALCVGVGLLMLDMFLTRPEKSSTPASSG